MLRFLIFLVLSVTAFPVLADNHLSLRIASDIWCPYTCEEGDRPGYLIELAQEALAEHKVRVEYKVINWARAVNEAKAGKFDALAGASIADAPNFLITSRAQININFEVFTLKEKKWDYKGSFAGKKIGVINGYSYDDKTNKEIAEKKREYVVVSGERGLESLVPMLNLGRIDAILETRGVFYESLKTLKIKDDLYKSVGSTSANVPHYISISPKTKEAQKIINWLEQGQKRLEKQGRLRELRKKYGLQ